MNLRAAIGLFSLALVTANAHGQTLTTGQISGTVTDPSGAVVPKAQVTVSNTNTGIKRTTESNSEGYYLVPLLDSGAYVVTIAAKGFETVSREGITVAVSRSALVDFRLQIGAEEIKVTISTEAPLIEPSNPNTTTTFNSTQLADLPNPGNDLSYVANLAPGVLLNPSQNGTTGGGNFEVNGLPAIANDFTIDGLDANNPYLNTNSTGASGLQLGLNAIQEVSINTTSYSIDQGRLGASQVNYVTKSGTNEFHGNAYEVWNGSFLNANDFFLNALAAKKPRSNVNEFGASLGGPLVKDKLFFFADVEGIRLVLPVVLSSTLPTPTFQNYVLQHLPLGGFDPVAGINLPPQPGEVPLYKNMFALMGDTSKGVPFPILDCPFDVTVPGAADGCANTRTFSAAPVTNETLFTLKFDYHLSANDSIWFRFQLNEGQQTAPDAVNPTFDLVTSVPERSGAAGWTHVFGPNLVNQFNPGISYASRVPKLADAAKALAAVPIAYDGSAFGLSVIGANYLFNNYGTAPTVWQLNDNLSWNFGRHSVKLGENFRRVLLSYSNSLEATPYEIACSLEEFTFGATCVAGQVFAKALGVRIRSVNMSTYAMDSFKATRKLNFTFGLRATWNSNPVSPQDVFSRLVGSFESISHDVNQPLNVTIVTNRAHAFAETQPVIWEPRVALAYQPGSKTVFRSGFGIFGQPVEAAFYAISGQNPPSLNPVSSGIFGAAGGIGIAPGGPGVSDSAVDAALAANKALQSSFFGGGLSCASPSASPSSCVPPVGINAGVEGHHKWPYNIQWSSSVEQQIGTTFLLTGKYVGTRSLQNFYALWPNAYQTVCSGCFAPFPFNTALDPRFGTVSELATGANSSYHSLQLSGQKRLSHGLAFQVNYTYSHCIDTGGVSNGGDVQFNANSIRYFQGPLQLTKGDCDYDVRHSLNGWYLYELPFHSKTPWVDKVIGGWQVSGNLYLRGGLPFSVLSSSLLNGRFINGFIRPSANAVTGQKQYATGPVPGITQPGTIQWLNPNAFESVWDPTTGSCVPATSVQNCQNGNVRRNALRGPDFRWTDLAISKKFKVNERASLKFDAQFYNLFNHPNFSFPNSGSLHAGIPGKPATLANFGTINTTLAPATGLLGSGLGGDSSVRMIALRGTVTF
jgi:hypothetical protein